MSNEENADGAQPESQYDRTMGTAAWPPLPDPHRPQRRQQRDQGQGPVGAAAYPRLGESNPYGQPPRGQSPRGAGQSPYGRPPTGSGQSGTGQSPYGQSPNSGAGQPSPYRNLPVRGSGTQGSQPSPYGTPLTTGRAFNAGVGTTSTASYPTHYGAPPASERPAKRRRGCGGPALLLWSLLMLAVGGSAGWWLSANVNAFDDDAVEDAVAEVLRDDFGLSDLESVSCPNWIRIQQGESFQCTFEYAGGTQTVTVTQGSQSGQLVVGAPE